MTIREVAEDFIKRMNPSGWNGTGSKPYDILDDRILTYEIDGCPDIEVDIHFEEDESEWFTVIEGIDKASGDHLGGWWMKNVCDTDILNNNLNDYIKDISEEYSERYA